MRVHARGCGRGYVHDLCVRMRMRARTCVSMGVCGVRVRVLAFAGRKVRKEGAGSTEDALHNKSRR